MLAELAGGDRQMAAERTAQALGAAEAEACRHFLDLLATGSEGGPAQTPPLSTTSVLALILSAGAFLVGGLWLAAVVLGPLTQPYCGVPDVPDGCLVDSSYWWWAVPPSPFVAGAVTLAIVVVRRSRQLDRHQT